MDGLTKISVGSATVFAIALILISVLVVSQPAKPSASTSVGNFITQNTVDYGNNTSYMLQWNGSSEVIQGYTGNALIYSGRVTNGTQIVITVADGQSATVYADNSFVVKLTPP